MKAPAILKQKLKRIAPRHVERGGLHPSNPDSFSRMDQIPMHSMSPEQLKDRLMRMAKRARAALVGTLGNGDDTVVEGGQYASRLGGKVADFLENLAKGLTDPAMIRQRNEFLAKVEHDPEANRQFCALRLETYNNYLIAQMRWIEYFFEVVNLAQDERPMVQNHYDKEIKCYYVGADGGPKMFKVFFDDTEQLLPLRVIVTPKMRYKVEDIYRGNIVDQAVRSLTIARDLTNKMEANCKTLLDSVMTTFTFTGPKANWPFVTNSYINTANMPGTNDVQCIHPHGGSVGSEIGSFDYPVLEEVINYAKLLDAVKLGEMSFRPTGRIRVPSTHIRNFGTYAAGSDTAGSATPASPLANGPEQEIYEDGWGGVNYKGIKWIFEPDATLDPTINRCYPEFTIKPGRMFLKPSMDREVVRTGAQDYQLFERNEEERYMKKVFGAYINSATAIYAARINY